ncbi:eukaryotic aspartyl protease domain-containing protein [Ditylenchus destructor]|uniref:Eukaryotic aspartyl protease domain-containing protein n=1 Tax=Ditylenchus destructor TaxID=166010 RepID=A0AAD4N6X9_9BILA|nr:eukaryotic aspartyl protease domain-containing protein [Ditylenchus destructor]
MGNPSTHPSYYHLLAILLLHTLTYSMCDASVHKFPTKSYELPQELARQRLLYKLGNKINAKHHLAVSNNNLTNVSVNGTKYTELPFTPCGIYEVVEITAGTPPQSFLVELDWHDKRYLELLDVNSTDDYYPESWWWGKDTFNSSASSTFTPVDDRIKTSAYRAFYGHLGNDMVQMGSLNFNITFVIWDDVYFYFRGDYYQLYKNVSGILGLSPASQLNGTNWYMNMTSTVAQLIGQMDQPLITVWSNSSHSGEGSGLLTFGAEDTDHCESNWIYTTKLTPDGKTSLYYSGYTVHLDTIHGTWTNGTEQTFEIDLDLAIVPDISCIVLPWDYAKFFWNISKAVYHDHGDLLGYWIVDCDTTNLGNVTFTVGGPGYDRSNNKYNLTITVDDYSKYYKDYDVCYLDLSFYPAYFTTDRDNTQKKYPFILGRQFAQNHCVAYDLENDNIGIAESKYQNLFLKY